MTQALKETLESARQEILQLTYYVNKQVEFGGRTFYVAHDSDIDAMVLEFANTTSGSPIGPCHCDASKKCDEHPEEDCPEAGCGDEDCCKEEKPAE